MLTKGRKLSLKLISIYSFFVPSEFVFCKCVVTAGMDIALEGVPIAVLILKETKPINTSALYQSAGFNLIIQNLKEQRVLFSLFA